MLPDADVTEVMVVDGFVPFNDGHGRSCRKVTAHILLTVVDTYFGRRHISHFRKTPIETSMESGILSHCGLKYSLVFSVRGCMQARFYPTITTPKYRDNFKLHSLGILSDLSKLPSDLSEPYGTAVIHSHSEYGYTWVFTCDTTNDLKLYTSSDSEKNKGASFKTYEYAQLTAKRWLEAIEKYINE
jgi:hypothetical protein